LPVRYRYGKGFWRETVVGLFPGLYAEMAQQHNMIDWVSTLRAPEARRFVYHELIESPGILDEFVRLPVLKQALDAFYAPRSVTRPAARASIMSRLNASPQAYHLAHKVNYFAKKWTGQLSHALPPERLALRLLILKTWCEVFLPASTFPTL